MAEDPEAKDGRETRMFQAGGREPAIVRTILLEVVHAMEEKGYNPVTQIVGYLLSGDPAYITSHRGARELIMRLERDEVVEELVARYLKSD